VAKHFRSPDQIVISKMPGNLRDRWNRNVYQIRSNRHREPAFKDLIDFIDKETILATDPLFSKEAIVTNPGCVTNKRKETKSCQNIFLLYSIVSILQ